MGVASPGFHPSQVISGQSLYLLEPQLPWLKSKGSDRLSSEVLTGLEFCDLKGSG